MDERNNKKGMRERLLQTSANTSVFKERGMTESRDSRKRRKEGTPVFYAEKNAQRPGERYKGLLNLFAIEYPG